MKKTKHDGRRCRYSDEYANHTADSGILELRVKRRGTIAGKDGYGNWVVKWDECPREFSHWSPNTITILPDEEGK